MTQKLAAVLAAFSLAAPALAQTPSGNRPVAEFSSCAKPVWPRESLRKEEQGTVQLAFLIGADGSVRDSRVERSSGHPLLDVAAQEGLAQCKFKPAQDHGQPVEVWTRMRYVWTLEDQSPQQVQASLDAARAGAQRGEAAAQYRLGLMYLNGQGVRQDRDEAGKWLEKAAAQGSAQAQEALGLMNMPRPNYAGDAALAISWFRQAAEQGRPVSQHFLGLLLRKLGKADEALPWLRKAAAQNHAGAQTLLGAMLLDGKRAEDQPEAIALLDQAARQNDRSAQVILGECYEKGTGVPQDYAQAAALYQRASTANSLRGMVALARLYDNGLGVPQDAARARQLREQAAQAQ